jgi:hypothetical protein
MDDLYLKLDRAEKLNSELRLEVEGLKRLNNEQGRALSKMVNENDYPKKIRGLIDELKYSKTKIKDLDAEVKREKRISY